MRSAIILLVAVGIYTLISNCIDCRRLQTCRANLPKIRSATSAYVLSGYLRESSRRNSDHSRIPEYVDSTPTGNRTMNKRWSDDQETNATECENDSARDPANLGHCVGYKDRPRHVSGKQVKNGDPRSYSKGASCLHSFLFIWGQWRKLLWFLSNLRGFWVDFPATILLSLQCRIEEVILKDKLGIRRVRESNIIQGLWIHWEFFWWKEVLYKWSVTSHSSNTVLTSLAPKDKNIDSHARGGVSNVIRQASTQSKIQSQLQATSE